MKFRNKIIKINQVWIRVTCQIYNKVWASRIAKIEILRILLEEIVKEYSNCKHFKRKIIANSVVGM